jgi:diguanylate cyclase (GGDEF)-like protein
MNDREPTARLRALFARGGDPYAGADVALAQRFAVVMWPAGTAVMLALVPFFPPIRQVGAWGWLLPLEALVVTAAGFAFALRHRERVTYDFLYVAGFYGLAHIALMQWLGGGRVAPYHELILIQLIGTGLMHPPRRFVLFLLCAYAAGFAPLLYAPATAEPGQIATELSLWTGIGVFLLVLMRNIRAQRVAAHELARVDALTELGNRRAFDEALTDALARARRGGTRVSVLVTDLDDFKRINDQHGHVVGDRCLQEAAEILRTTVRVGERCFRWGGDEFAVLLPDSGEGDAAALARRIEDAVSGSHCGPHGEPLTLTVGYAEIGGESTAADAVSAADAVLLALKGRQPPVSA